MDQSVGLMNSRIGLRSVVYLCDDIRFHRVDCERLEVFDDAGNRWELLSLQDFSYDEEEFHLLSDTEDSQAEESEEDV